MRMLTRSALKEQAAKLKTDIPAVFLALKDKRTPLIAKTIAAVTVAYALSPIDLIPDFIPVLDYLDSGKADTYVGVDRVQKSGC